MTVRNSLHLSARLLPTLCALAFVGCSDADLGADPEAGLEVAEVAQPLLSCGHPGYDLTHVFYERNYTISSSNGQRNITLTFKQTRVGDKSSAIITGRLIEGDQVWVERSSDNSNWDRCSKTRVNSNSYTRTSAAAYHRGYYMRPCFDYAVYAGNRNTICGPSKFDDG